MKIAVIGAGSWGTALAILLARNGHEVSLIGRESEELAALRTCRENLRYLPGFMLPEGVAVLDEQDAGGLSPEMTVVAVPSSAVREVIESLPFQHQAIVVASKGLEPITGLPLCEVVENILPGVPVGVLSGPNLAVEIVRRVPTAAVSGSLDSNLAELARSAFMCRTYRVYLSRDVIGIELAGSMKNVLAIGAGMSDGLGYGDNTKGALLSRGLHEMTLLGKAMGATTETFLGLAGVGDLFATAASQLSRNYRVGRALAEGLSLAEALEKIDQVAEGVSTSESVQMLARQKGVEMPLFNAIENVLRGQIQPLTAVENLMERLPRYESFEHQQE